jgi:hypothetical protein
MGEVIQFPQPGGTEVLHFDEKHAFGEIGGCPFGLERYPPDVLSPLLTFR